MPRGVAGWLSAPSDICHSSIPPLLPPSLHPPVILGIYSWPPSMYKLNYLSGEIGSLHDRILFVPFDSIKINKVQSLPC